MFRLEQNYRSTGNILKVANTLIANNTGRLGKNLWTSGSDGERIRLYAAFNERDEAEFVMNRIRDWMNHGGVRRRDGRHLYARTPSRACSRSLHVGTYPYKVYGGLRFFERAEIKDALAYSAWCPAAPMTPPSSAW
jgi:DNA helicase-2/ATP-dependent DNA helicase PcrA